MIDSPSGRLVVRSRSDDRVDLGTGAFACDAPGCLGVPQWAPTGGWLLWTVDPTTIGAWRPGLEGSRRITMPSALVSGNNPLSIQSLSIGTAEQLATFVAQAAANAAPGR